MSWTQLIFSYLFIGVFYSLGYVLYEYMYNRDISKLLDEPAGHRIRFYLVHTFYAILFWPIITIVKLFFKHPRKTR